MVHGVTKSWTRLNDWTELSECFFIVCGYCSWVISNRIKSLSVAISIFVNECFDDFIFLSEVKILILAKTTVIIMNTWTKPKTGLDRTGWQGLNLPDANYRSWPIPVWRLEKFVMCLDQKRSKGNWKWYERYGHRNIQDQTIQICPPGGHINF